MDYLHVCVLTFFTWKSIYGSISIVGYGSLQLNSHFVLVCYIPSFSSGATWSNTNLQPMACTSDGFCQLTSLDNFKFSANESGMFVIINPLLVKDDHIQWTCFYDSKSITYTVEISSANPTGQEKSDTLNDGEKAGIGIGCIVFVCGIALLVYYARRQKKLCFSS